MEDLRDHVISLGNHGFPQPNGPFGTTEGRIRANLQRFYEATTPGQNGWERRRLMLITHGGLVSEALALKWFAVNYQDIQRLNIYPLAVVWNSDLLSIILDEIEDQRRQHQLDSHVEALGLTSVITDYVTDPLIEHAVRRAGQSLWDEMKRNADGASHDEGGLAVTAAAIAELRQADPELEIHLVGHSAGAILNGPFLQLLTRDRPIATCTLLAPACTIDFYQTRYAPLIQAGRVGLTSLFNLTPTAERADNFMDIYRKSLLWLVSRALEGDGSGEGAPLLGLEEFRQREPAILDLIGRDNLVLAPTVDQPEGTRSCSNATTHAGFALEDAKRLTLRATLCRILNCSIISSDFTVGGTA